jgi:hypothetical protein
MRGCKIVRLLARNDFQLKRACACFTHAFVATLKANANGKLTAVH